MSKEEVSGTTVLITGIGLISSGLSRLSKFLNFIRSFSMSVITVRKILRVTHSFYVINKSYLFKQIIPSSVEAIMS